MTSLLLLYGAENSKWNYESNENSFQTGKNMTSSCVSEISTVCENHVVEIEL